MNLTPYQLLLWLHLLCMVGIFGSLLVTRLGLPAGARTDAGLVRSVLRLASVLLLLGAVFGIALYVILIRAAKGAGGGLPSSTHMIVGIKFLLMLVVGGALGMSTALLKKGQAAPAGILQWTALAALALASLLGVIL